MHDTALLALAPDTRGAAALPSMHDALWRCESLHEALVRRSAEQHPGRPSPCLTGCDETRRPLRGHGHATLIPLDLDRDGRLDHVAVHAPMGFDDAAVAALERVRKTWAKGLPDIFVTLVGLGQRADIAARVPALASGETTWVSQTPFVPPRHLKPRGASALLGQVCAELASRGLPEPRAVEVHAVAGGSSCYVPATEAWSLWHRPAVWLRPDAVETAPLVDIPVLASEWRHFRRVRRDEARRPPVAVAFGLRITFAEPVSGPISIGYASHYGLGSFVPA